MRTWSWVFLYIFLLCSVSHSRQITGSGEAAFFDSTSNSDALRISMTNVSAPPSGKAYFAWLLADNDTSYTKLGQLPVQGNGTVFLAFRDNGAKNLLATDKKLLITLETGSFSGTKPTLNAVVFGDSLFGHGTPSMNSPLAHLRSCLVSFSNTYNNLGLALVSKIDTNDYIAHAGLARDGAKGNNVGDARTHSDHVYDFIMGRLTTLVIGNSSVVSHTDPVGYGFRRYWELGTHDSSQGGAGFFGGAGYHVVLAMNDPSATFQMKREGSSAFTALKNAFGAQNDSGLARKVTDRALRIIAGNYVTGGLVTEGDPFFQLASEFLRGTVGSTDTASATGGVKQAYYHIQRMATFTLTAPTSKVALTRTSFNFGTIPVGSSKSDSLFLRNTGTNLLVVDSVRVTNQYFSIQPTSASIALNDSANLKVTYSPLAQGTHSGLIIFYSNSPSARDTVAIQGTASSSSSVALTKTSLNFGTIPVGSSKADSLYLRNTGANLLVVDSVRVTNQYFSILPTSASIALNDSAKLKVTYSPLAQGTHSGLIIFYSNSPSARDTVAIQGTASASSSVVRGLFDQTPARFALHQNYPNPFNPSTEITFEIPVRSRIWIAVYNILGQEISRLVDGQDVMPGTYSTHWQSTATSGIYICRLQALDLGTQRSVSFSRRMVLLR